MQTDPSRPRLSYGAALHNPEPHYAKSQVDVSQGQKNNVVAAAWAYRFFVDLRKKMTGQILGHVTVNLESCYCCMAEWLCRTASTAGSARKRKPKTPNVKGRCAFALDIGARSFRFAHCSPPAGLTLRGAVLILGK